MHNSFFAKVYITRRGHWAYCDFIRTLTHIFYVNSSHSYFFLQPLVCFYFSLIWLSFFCLLRIRWKKFDCRIPQWSWWDSFFAQFFRHSFITCGFLAREGVSWYTMIEDIVYAEILISVQVWSLFFKSFIHKKRTCNLWKVPFNFFKKGNWIGILTEPLEGKGHYVTE